MELINNKKIFLESHNAKLSELEKQQCEYKKLVTNSISTRKEAFIGAKYEALTANLRKEKDELRALNWVAERGFNNETDQRNLDEIECHIECQEHLSADIKQLKLDIANMERANSRITKEISAMNKRTIPEAQFQEHFRHTHKKMQNLENELEVCKNRECAFRAQNSELRHELVTILKDRTVFNDAYAKLIQRLSRDKKYMTDLIEYVMDIFDNIINVYDKMESLGKKNARDKDKCKAEMEDILREVESGGDLEIFLNVKGKKRELADYPPKEYKRRQDFHEKYNKKIHLYRRVLEKISDYTESADIRAVISRYNEQENLYYSYFNYANEMSYHITILDHAVNQLYSDITGLKEDNANALADQLIAIEELGNSLRDLHKTNAKMTSRRKEQDRELQNLLINIEDIFELVKADATPLLALLGDHSHVHLENVPRVLRLLERRIVNVTASVFVLERLDESKMIGEYTVEQIHRLCDWPTALDDIVLTTQCPECAEGEIVAVDEGGDAIHPHSMQETRKKLHEKVAQPEMQYRLHSIDDCKLPRSRVLAAKNA